eukprot:jgi/Mesen1/7870/ME000042S07313
MASACPIINACASFPSLTAASLTSRKDMSRQLCQLLPRRQHIPINLHTYVKISFLPLYRLKNNERHLGSSRSCLLNQPLKLRGNFNNSGSRCSISPGQGDKQVAQRSSPAVPGFFDWSNSGPKFAEARLIAGRRALGPHRAAYACSAQSSSKSVSFSEISTGQPITVQGDHKVGGSDSLYQGEAQPAESQCTTQTSAESQGDHLAGVDSRSCGPDEAERRETGGEMELGQSSRKYIVVNLYHFAEIKDPHAEVERHLAFVEGRDIMGRIYISEQGINAQLSGPVDDALAYGNWVCSQPAFCNVRLQVSPSPDGHAFPRLRLRYKPSLVQVEGGTASLPLTDPATRAVHLTPAQWRERIASATCRPSGLSQLSRAAGQSREPTRGAGRSDASGEESIKGSAVGGPADGECVEKQRGETARKVLLLDVRNGYEWDVGHFQGAARPEVNNFRNTDFGMSSAEGQAGAAAAADPLAEVDRENTDILMYCTGGIRCDVYSTLLRERGFKNLYTLAGGVARYLKEEGPNLWAGNLFVFDSRLAVAPGDYKRGGQLANGETPLDDPARLGASEADGGEGGEALPESPEFARCASCDAALRRVKHRNCANIDCNKLYLACLECAQASKGTCCAECSVAPRLRPYIEGPYNRWHHYRPEEPKRPPGTLPDRAANRQRRRESLREYQARRQAEQAMAAESDISSPSLQDQVSSALS